MKYWGDYFGTKEPVCVYCDHKIVDTWDHGIKNEDGELTEIICPNCEKQLVVSPIVSVTYATYGDPNCHHKLHAGYTENSFTCELCFRDFYRPTDFPGASFPKLTEGKFTVVKELTKETF